MNRVAVFAHYDKNNIIEDYVLYYLQELKKIVNYIVFVSDCDIEQNELTKISNLVDKQIIGKHNEYDFGSYKRGFLFVKENDKLKDCDELIFANDSCFAPLFPFNEMFSEMSPKNVDFWGSTKNLKKKNEVHIQSYFIVFKPTVFLSKIFVEFIQNIKKEENKKEIVDKYEIGLSQLLINNGFKFGIYSKNICDNFLHPHVYKYKKLITNERIPFLKKNIILKKEPVYPFNIKNLILKTNYNYQLIKNFSINNKPNISLLDEIILILKTLKKFTIRMNLKEKRICLFDGDYINFGRRTILSKKTNKTVCYTCITKNYDKLIQHSYISKDWDYVCFTDDKKLIKKGKVGIWLIKPLVFNSLEDKRNSGWHKTHPHILFKEYEQSIWVDGNIDILTSDLEERICNSTKNILVPEHNIRNCIYDECNEVVYYKKEIPEISKSVSDFLILNNMPKNYGLHETNIVYRKHNDQQIIGINEMWWGYIRNLSKRDQLSFSYVLFKNNIIPANISIPNTRENPNYCLCYEKLHGNIKRSFLNKIFQ